MENNLEKELNLSKIIKKFGDISRNIITMGLAIPMGTYCYFSEKLDYKRIQKHNEIVKKGYTGFHINIEDNNSLKDWISTWYKFD